MLGTANDPNTYDTGVSHVYVSVAQINGGATTYFNGSGFVPSAENYILATGTATWSYWSYDLGAVNLIDGAHLSRPCLFWSTLWAMWTR